jgi:hypothetical protein
VKRQFPFALALSFLPLLALAEPAQRPADTNAGCSAPINYPGMTVQVDTNGVQAAGYRFSDDCNRIENRNAMNLC